MVTNMNDTNTERILTKIEEKYSEMKLANEIKEDRISFRTKGFNLY